MLIVQYYYSAVGYHMPLFDISRIRLEIVIQNSMSGYISMNMPADTIAQPSMTI